ncbi:MAG: 50S ribosomal protein L17 [Candidatus Omnitrophota bacterium]
MRHAKIRAKLNLNQGQRKSLTLNLSRSLFAHQRVITTVARAKVVRPVVERILSLSKTNSLNNRRRVFQILGDHALVSKLFEKLGPLFNDRSYGFTRIIHFKKRRGDDASLVIFELVKKLAEEKPKPIEKKEKKVAPAQVPIAQEKPQKQETVLEEKIEPKKEKQKIIKKEEKKPEPKPKPPTPSKFLGSIGKIFRRKQEP